VKEIAMTPTDQENLRRFLVACRHDIAHKRGWTDADNETWARTHLAEAIDRYLAAYRDALNQESEAMAEAAFAAIKAWAQA
jgi:hypothetical protein